VPQCAESLTLGWEATTHSRAGSRLHGKGRPPADPAGTAAGRVVVRLPPGPARRKAGDRGAVRTQPGAAPLSAAGDGGDRRGGRGGTAGAPPSRGPRKLRAWLAARDAEVVWPAASTSGVLFDEAGRDRPNS